MLGEFGSTDALIVVAVQNDFCEGGAFDLQGGGAIVAPINALAQKFQTVVMTQDFHPAGHISFASSHEGCAPFQQKFLSREGPAGGVVETDQVYDCFELSGT